MIDTNNWQYFYKITDIGNLSSTNMLYTPLMSPDESMLCMLWDENSPYQKNRNLSKDLLNFFFEREVKYLTLFQRFSWAPKIYEIDIKNRKIIIEWNKESLNTIIYTKSRDLNSECSDWKDQLWTILSDLFNYGYYKMALYPHCFFIDKNKQIKSFDFYSTVHKSEKYIEISQIEGMIGPESGERFKAASTDGKLDLELFFKNTLQFQLSKTWKDNPFPEFYRRLFHNS